jgi:hypothetical protein
LLRARSTEEPQGAVITNVHTGPKKRRARKGPNSKESKECKETKESKEGAE